MCVETKGEIGWVLMCFLDSVRLYGVLTLGWTEVYDGRTGGRAGWEGYQRPRSHDWAGRVNVGLFFYLWWFCFCWLIAMIFHDSVCNLV